MGTGFTGDVFLVKDAETVEPFAIKLLKEGNKKNENFIQALKHEFDIANKFEHKNLIKVYKFIENGTLTKTNKIEEHN